MQYTYYLFYCFEFSADFPKKQQSNVMKNVNFKSDAPCGDINFFICVGREEYNGSHDSTVSLRTF
jgi:hypothetical protein